MKRTSSTRDTASQQKKKTRFVSPSEDPVNFAEEVDATLEIPQATRRNRVKTEGYDSDSSDDGESIVQSRKRAAEGGKVAGEDDMDDDMFAMGESEDTTAKTAGGKKKEEFLRLGDIEGQEFNDRDGDDSDVSDDPEDEDEAERRKKAGMGYELSSFNMREEMEEGKFTEDGTFVRTFDPHAMHDRWMEGTNDREIKKARRAKKAQERVERDRLKAEAAEAKRLGTKEDIEMELVGLLRKGESVLEALARLGAQVKKLKEKEKQSNKKQKSKSAHSMDIDSTISIHSSPPSQKSQIDRITSLASTLLSMGDVDIYNKTYEHFLRSIRSGANVEPTWEPTSADVKYEYRWDIPIPEGQGQAQVFGPFGESNMKAWFNAQYFGAAGEKVKVRRVGEEHWGDWDDIIE